MANIVVATLNVSFEEDTEGTQGILSLQLDDREDGMNGGDTSFKPGDDVYYFMYKDSNVTVLDHFTTAGGIATATDSQSGSSSVTIAIDENITFSNSDSGQLNYPPSESVSLNWQGRAYEIDKDGNTTPYSTLPDRTNSNLKIVGNKKIAGILRAQYNTTGTLYKLSGVPDTFTEAMIMAIGSIS